MALTNSSQLSKGYARGIFEPFKMVWFVFKIVLFGKHTSTNVSDDISGFLNIFIYLLVYRQGTYLLLEKCKTVCYRNLFKRVYFILDKHQISLSYVGSALKYLDVPMDLDEVECILANLIYRGYIRGYLSHSKRVLVLSKRDPFPTSSVVVS